MKKPSRKYLKKKADKLWSDIIRQRNDGMCEISDCGKMGGQPHHIVGRKNLVLRHDLRNGCNLCFTHHIEGKLSTINDPMWFLDWLKTNREEDYDYLMKKKHRIAYQVDYEEKIKLLQDNVIMT